MTKTICKKSNQNPGEFSLPQLPFAKNDLAPYYSEQIIDLHYGKHHQAYVTNLNNLLKDSDFGKNMNLEELIFASYQDNSKTPFFNNAAQIWNHTFFWNCLKKNGGGLPNSDFLKKIEESFSSYDNFKKEFIEKSSKVFGSGWCWLVLDKNNKLNIIQTSNAMNPMLDGNKPLMVVDVWEHAYYPDYQNRRPEFVEKFLHHLVNWDFAYDTFLGKYSG